MTEILTQYECGTTCWGGMRVEFTPPICPGCGVEYMPVLSLEERAIIINYQHTCPPEPEQ